MEEKNVKKTPRTILMKIGFFCSILLMADIAFFWYDDDIAFIFNLFYGLLFFVPLASMVLFLIAFVKSCWFRTVWHKAMFGCGVATILFFVAYMILQNPETNCDPDIMAEHYEEHKSEMKELCAYMQSALADSTAVTLEFKHNRLKIFHVTLPHVDDAIRFWDEEARYNREEQMRRAGLTEEEYDGIRKRLKSIGCIGIGSSRFDSDVTEIWFRRANMGMYSYYLFNRPMTDEEREEAFSDCAKIMYNDSTVFCHAGPAFGSDCFPQREKYLKKYPKKAINENSNKKNETAL
ncbi:MAG: hypothetical protein IJQ89_01090 [Bacteroidales bacterium]|nr:hypothetical protein [Bacteroidales bacterium]